MKRTVIIATTALALAGMSAAGINIPSDGSDGGLHVTSNTVIDLSLAVTGDWDDDNSAHAGVGIYDSNKWAVVFNYTNVTIAAGQTVSFKNHPSRAPVVWLVAGNVTIDGVVDLYGRGTRNYPEEAFGGPGGFRGGVASSGSIESGPGFGPGGGHRQEGYPSYGSVGYQGPPVYGNASLLPLIGGSGGGGSYGKSGGGGGGAILIACADTLSLAGEIRANGGRGPGGSGQGGGSGGAIRLVAETVSGNGTLNATGNADGRIRIERVSSPDTLAVSPSPSLVVLDPGATPLLWVPADGPAIRIVSIGGETAPAEPRASLGAEGADLVLVQTNSVPVVVETRNVEESSQVQVRLAPRGGGDFLTRSAVVQQIVSTNPPVILWKANVPTGPGYSVVQVRVIRP